LPNTHPQTLTTVFVTVLPSLRKSASRNTFFELIIKIIRKYESARKKLLTSFMSATFMAFVCVTVSFHKTYTYATHAKQETSTVQISQLIAALLFAPSKGMAGRWQKSTMLNNNCTGAFNHYSALEYAIIIYHGVQLLKLNEGHSLY